MNRIPLHHILIHNSELARALHQELLAGASFATLAREYSTCPSAIHNGNTGKHSPADLSPALSQVLTEAEARYPGPIKTSFGYHLLEIQSAGSSRENPDLRATTE